MVFWSLCILVTQIFSLGALPFISRKHPFSIVMVSYKNEVLATFLNVADILLKKGMAYYLLGGFLLGLIRIVLLILFLRLFIYSQMTPSIQIIISSPNSDGPSTTT